MSIMAKTPSGYKKIEKVYNGDTPVDKILDKDGNELYALQRELTGVPPLLFKGKEQSELSNYRIYGNTETIERTYSGQSPLTVPVYDGELSNYRVYGNTVNGASVGERTGNLFDEVVEQGSFNGPDGTETVALKNRVRSKNVTLGVGNYTISANGVDAVIVMMYLIDGTYARSESIANFQNLPFSFSLDAERIIRFAFRKNDNSSILPSDISNIMLNAGSTALPYEPYGYKVPVTVANGADTVTTNLYLPEPIKMVGDEAEYVDYIQQKLHRVRKNLLENTATSQTINGVTFTMNTDGSVTCNGTCVNNTASFHLKNGFKLNDETIQYTLTGCPEGGGRNSTYIMEYSNAVNQAKTDSGTGVTFTPFNKTDYPNAWVRIMIFAGYTCDNLTFYPMIRKADITDDTYEPYIENTEVDVTIPALPISTGTNIVTAETSVKPSNITVAVDESVSVGDFIKSGEHVGEYSVPVKVEGKNLLPNTATSQTINGVTFTVNDDGIVTCNGTAAQTAVYTLNDTFSLEPGTYKLTGCPAGGEHIDKYKLDIVAPPTTYGTDIGNGSSFTLSSTLTNAQYRIVIYNNQVCDNLTFYPMIRKADVTDDTYEPYRTPTITNLYLPAPIKMGETVELEDTNTPISVAKGTNILSVETEVQPTRMDVKGRIKTIS